jgi:uncharacterized protein YjiS (DUF1127 family)
MAIARIDLTRGRTTERADAKRRMGLLVRVITWDARFRDRRALEALGVERRADLGLSDADIRAETSKPVWRA